MRYYFHTYDDEICYNEEYWQQFMKAEELTEIEVFEAVPEKFYDQFWCKQYATVGQKDNKTCGKVCKKYAPRNGKNGCCKHYSTKVFGHGKKVTLNLINNN